MYNSPGKKDATGAFQPERKEFLSIFDPSALDYSIFDPSALDYSINNHAPKAAMRACVLEDIRIIAPTLLAVFSHGWRTGIQFGFGLPHVDDLAVELARGCTSVRVVFYCCSTGSGPGVGGDGGFADALRDALCRAGAVHCQVDAHDKAGHTTKNPYVVRFLGQGSATGGQGGQWIVAPKSALWGRWVRALRGDLRFRFPLMDVAAIHAELEAGK